MKYLDIVSGLLGLVLLGAGVKLYVDSKRKEAEVDEFLEALKAERRASDARLRACKGGVTNLFDTTPSPLPRA